jgi:hypothetical protein
MPLGADPAPQALIEPKKARISGLFFRAGALGALVAAMLFFPLLGIAVGIGSLFGVSPRMLGTFGGEINLAVGLFAWWALLLVPSVVYAALAQD